LCDGVAASPLGKALGVETDKAGRVFVESDLSLPGFKEYFVIGDNGHAPAGKAAEPVPGVSPAAMQEGHTTAKNILRDMKGRAASKISLCQ